MDFAFNYNMGSLIHEISHTYHDEFQKIFDYADAIKNAVTGNGAGLTRGFLIDRMINEVLENTHIFKQYHEGQADIMAQNIPYSIKTLTNGGNDIALCWSKNPTIEKKELEHDILLINLKSEKWYTTEQEIKRGVYMIDKNIANKYITLYSNNKTDYVLRKKSLHDLIMHNSIKNGWYVEIESKDNYEWSIIDGIKTRTFNN